LVWNRIKADTLGVPILKVMGAGGAPLGATLLAAYGEGMLRNIEEAAAHWIHTGAVTQPGSCRVPSGRQRIERYVALLDSINGWASSAD
jgi:sugar (pentulose or hexulose) kinase